MSIKQTVQFRQIFMLLLWGAAFAILSPPRVCAQALSGSIVGDISDTSHAAIPQASVTIRDLQTNETRTAVTNESGSFTFLALPPSNYEVKVTKDGFRTAVRSGVSVTVNTVSRADIQLELGAVSETVTVSADAAQLQTDTADVHVAINADTLENLPVAPGRNYQSTFVMLPGFTPPSSQVSIPGNPTRALLFYVNGTSTEGVVTRIDGASSTNIWRPNAVAYIPALESIEAVNAVTSSFTAENGLAGGAVINLQIKSGTNAVHGSAFEYYDGNALEARAFFLPPGQQNGKLVENQFGGTLGGPILKNKLFYFGSYEGTYWHALAGGIFSIPTPAMIAGDLSGSTTPIYDPMTGTSTGTGRTVFPGNQIPLSRMPAPVQLILPFWPSPNIPGGASQNNYYGTGPFFLDRNTVDSKVNWIVSPKLTTYVRYSYLHFNTFNGTTFGNQFGGAPLPPIGGQAGPAFGDTTSVTASATYVASPTLVFDTYFGYTRAQGNSQQPELNQNIGLNVLKIPGTNGTRWFEGGWPEFTIADFAAFGAPDAIQPNLLNDPAYEWVFNVGWTHGAHSIRFGTTLLRQDLNELQAQFMGGGTAFAPSGGFSFAVGETSAPGASTSQYNAFASFLLGAVDSLGRNYLSPQDNTCPTCLDGSGYTLRSWQYAAYVQDQWQVNPKLTVTYGVRWEYYPMPTRANRGIELYDFGTNTVEICGYNLLPKNCGISFSKRLFEPRLGVAYRLSDSLVLRAGYGLTNDPYNLLRPFRVNYPLMTALVITAPNTYTPASYLQNGIPAAVAPSYGNGIVSIPGNTSADTIIPDQFKRGYIQSWNLTVQKRFGHGWTGEAGYVATRAVGELGYFNRNAGTVGGGIASEPLDILYGRTANTAQITGLGTYKFDSLQARLQHHFAGGYQLGVNYTLGKSLGTAGNDNGDGTPLVEAPGYYNLNYSRTDIDHRNNVEIEGTVELPFGHNKKFANGRVGSLLFGGWRINALLSLYNGAPFNVTAPGTSLNAPGSTQRADQVLPTVALLGGVGPGQYYYNPNAFAQVTQVRFGSAGFYVLDSPPTRLLNTGLFREFRLKEKISLQFRAEATNTTNTPSFAAPNGTVGSSAFMTITATQGTGREGVDQRLLRVGLRLGF
jgi:carboxypeptidase family protein/TonB-dependent receptor-like protein